VSDEPSNAASRFLHTVGAALTEGIPTEEAVRAGLTDDFAYQDRRRGMRWPEADAESYPAHLRTIWQTGADGQPRFEAETLAVLGERFAAMKIQTDYGNGMVTESLHVFGLDATLRKLQLDLDFDLDDRDGAIAEMERLQSQADAI
jgi:hypothetical protein